MTNQIDDAKQSSTATEVGSGKPVWLGKSSTIRLTTFALYRVTGSKPDTSVEVVAGALDARMGEDSVIELLADNVPFSSPRFKKRAPGEGHGLLMLYGIKDTLEEIMKWRKVAREKKAQFASAEVEIDVGYMEQGLVDFKMLKEREDAVRFVNLRRMTAETQTKILSKFALYAATDGSSEDSAMDRVSQIANHPEYFDRLFRDEKAIKNLSVFAIPVADDPGGKGKMRQVAYVRPGAKIVGIKQGMTEARIVLPRWMTDETEAAKFRRLSKT